MTPLTPIQHPYIRDLMVSMNVFGKTRSGVKNSRIWNTLRKEFKNVFQKPWSSDYSTEMFSNGFVNTSHQPVQQHGLVILKGR
jgi:hypothetical protein